MWALLRTTNFWLSVIYVHFVSKENLFVLCSLLNDWNYLWTKYCKLPFLAICRSQFPLFDIYCTILIAKSENCAANELEKKKSLIILKGFIKQPVIKQSPFFLSFSFLIYPCMSVFFSFLIKSFVNFGKLIRFHRIWQWKKIENTEIWKYFAKKL